MGGLKVNVKGKQVGSNDNMTAVSEILIKSFDKKNLC